MKCNYCGAVVAEGDTYCQNCGTPMTTVEDSAQAPQVTEAPYQETFETQQNPQPQWTQPQPQTPPVRPGHSMFNIPDALWILVGIFVPLAGVALFFCWKDSAPGAGKFAIIGSAIGAGFSVLYFILNMLIQLLAYA